MKIIIQIVPVTFVMGTIFFLSHQSGDRLSLPFSGADKLAHIFAYGVLALSVLWFFGKEGLDSPGRTTFLTVLFCVLYGMSDEFHQSFILLRSMSIFDLFADAAGAFCLSLVWLMSTTLRQKIVSYQRRVFTFLQLR